MIKSFRDLEVYRESLQLAIEIEQLMRIFPQHEKYLLVDQLRRASRAIPALIAEGYAKRRSIKTFQKFLNDATAEANEVLTHLELADRFGYIKKEKYGRELIERYDTLGKKLYNLRDNWQNYK